MHKAGKVENCSRLWINLWTMWKTLRPKRLISPEFSSEGPRGKMHKQMHKWPLGKKWLELCCQGNHKFSGKKAFKKF